MKLNEKPNILKLSNVIVFLHVMILLSGCAHVPVASTDKDFRAKEFQPPEGKANIYVFRLKEFFGDGILFQVAVDGSNASGIAPGTFRLFIADPGKRTVSVNSNENQDAVEIDAQAGRNYFVDISPKMGLITARVSANLDTDEAGRRSVGKCKLTQK
jgi:hypothetical protein